MQFKEMVCPMLNKPCIQSFCVAYRPAMVWDGSGFYPNAFCEAYKVELHDKDGNRLPSWRAGNAT